MKHTKTFNDEYLTFFVPPFVATRSDTGESSCLVMDRHLCSIASGAVMRDSLAKMQPIIVYFQLGT